MYLVFLDLIPQIALLNLIWLQDLVINFHMLNVAPIFFLFFI